MKSVELSFIRHSTLFTRHLLDSFQIVAGAGIHADHFSLVDEERDGDDGTGFEGSRFGAALRGIAAQTRIGLGDDEFHRLGRFDAEHGGFPSGDLDRGVVFEELRAVADLPFGKLKLIEVGHIHEIEIVAVAVLELDVAALNDGGFHRLARAPRALKGGSGLQVAEARTHKGAAFARFDVLKFEDLIHLAFKFDGEAGFKICG